MSEEINPDVINNASDVEQAKSDVQETVEPVVNFAEKNLSELSGLFEQLMDDADRLKKPKEAEAIKSAFYKRLSREKMEAGLGSEVDEPSGEDAPVVNEDEKEEKAQVEKENPFKAIEDGFKSLYNKFRKERAEYTREQDAQKQENLEKKQAVIEDLKQLVEKQEEVNATFPAFREIQARWRAIGQVPVQNFRLINDTYQFYVEKFYDKVQINKELRDLDFTKNLEAKQKFCEAAEKLSENQNVVEAFRELQKLHEQWKEFGPVAKEFREQIWDRFKAATTEINKKYQEFFESQKEHQAENLEAKTKLCEQVEEIAEKEDIASTPQWAAYSTQIEEIQKTWKTIGYASRKENQKIYERFRAACDKFFEKKRVFYNEIKGSMNENVAKKMSLIEQAEALKSSTEWKKATDQFIALQKQWKEIGAVPRKKSEQLWKRFRAACDEFFAERDKQSKPENAYYANLKAKKTIIDEINAFESSDQQVLNDAMQSFNDRWREIGFVPFKEKDAIAQAFKDAMQAKFPNFGSGRPSSRPSSRSQRPLSSRGGNAPRGPLSEKDKLVQKHVALQQQIDTYENNIGFFAASKNSQPLIKQMQDRIENAKEELKELEQKIRDIENSQD